MPSVTSRRRTPTGSRCAGGTRRVTMGRLTFTEYFHLLLTGEEPTEDQVFFLDLPVSIAEHGMMPTNVAARMTLAADPDALQGCGGRHPRAIRNSNEAHGPESVLPMTTSLRKHELCFANELQESSLELAQCHVNVARAGFAAGELPRRCWAGARALPRHRRVLVPWRTPASGSAREVSTDDTAADRRACARHGHRDPPQVILSRRCMRRPASPDASGAPLRRHCYLGRRWRSFDQAKQVGRRPAAQQARSPQARTAAR